MISSPNISVIGATFSGNRGAEAMLTTVISQLRKARPKARFNVFSYYPDIDKKLVKDNQILIYSSTPLYLTAVLLPCSLLYKVIKILGLTFLLDFFPSSVKSLAESKVMIDIAGISFNDGREKYLPFKILTILPAIILGVPVVKFAQALGPFNNFLNRWSAKIMLPRCKMIYARGRKTYEYLLKLDLSKINFKLSSDTAFLQRKGDSVTYENEEYFNKIILQIADIKKCYKVIGICPSSVVNSLDKEGKYFKTLIYLIEELINNNYGIIVFPNASLKGFKSGNNDLIIIKRLQKALGGKDNLFFINKTINTDQIKDIIRCCNITVVSRFHAMIASFSLGVPVLVIGWSHKYREVMEEFGQQKLVMDYREIDCSNLITSIRRVLKQKNIQNKIRTELKRIKILAKEQIEDTIKLL